MKIKKSLSNYDFHVDVGRRIFVEHDQEPLIQKFRLDADERCIYLEYMNTPCRINRESGQIDEFHDDAWTECRSYSIIMTIYDLFTITLLVSKYG